MLPLAGLFCRRMTETMSAKAYREMIAKDAAKRPNKFNAKRVRICIDCGGGFVVEKRCKSCGSTHTRLFDSKAEANRFGELRILQIAGEIRALTCQPPFELKFEGVNHGRYNADFEYIVVASDERVVEDVKGGNATDTAQSKLKRKLVKTIHGVEVQVVRR